MLRTREGDGIRGCGKGMMNFEERACTFTCNGSRLYGILSLPERAASRGVLIAVGGPQYRVGSHRQFTLLSRHLAARGVPVLRFDFRGMGDSEGDVRTFEDVGDDLRCAIDKFVQEAPFVEELVIWGLCDAASAALFYAYQDSRVTGLVLLNPWVRTDQGAAKAYLKHYYLRRLFDPELWSKLWAGKFDFVAAARSAAKITGQALALPQEASIKNTSCSSVPLPERMFHGFSRFKGKVLLIISGNDLTAQEFCDLIKDSRDWQNLLASAQVSRRNLREANHTFSKREWRDQVAVWTTDWIQSW